MLFGGNVSSLAAANDRRYSRYLISTRANGVERIAHLNAMSVH